MSLFLNSLELSQIQKDVRDAINSKCGIDIAIHYKTPNTPTTNEAYGIQEATSWTNRKIRCRAMQRIIRPTDTEILQFGILQVGDCIFYLHEDTDLSKMSYNSAWIEAATVTWVPAGKKMDNLHRYAVLNLGETQLAQVIPATVKQN